MTKLKTIREFHYCLTGEREHDFSGYIWPTIERNYALYHPVNSPDVFEQHPVLYELKRNNSCLRLRRNDYLLKVANAVGHFGQQCIIPDLNEFCRNYVDDPPPILLESYRVPDFSNWSDVTNYVGNRQNHAVQGWLREKKMRVFGQIAVIADRHGISNRCWDSLISLYEERNAICHGNVNRADAESMRQFAAENVQDRNEQESISALHASILNLLMMARRSHR
jgi:hypothetical protein